MINRPKELFAIFQKQSIENKEYESLMKEREINQREIERLERKENEIEMDYYDGKLSEEKKDALVKHTIQQRTSKEERNMDLDKKLDTIINTRLNCSNHQVFCFIHSLIISFFNTSAAIFLDDRHADHETVEDVPYRSLTHRTVV